MRHTSSQIACARLRQDPVPVAAGMVAPKWITSYDHNSRTEPDSVIPSPSAT